MSTYATRNSYGRSNAYGGASRGYSRTGYSSYPSKTRSSFYRKRPVVGKKKPLRGPNDDILSMPTCSDNPQVLPLLPAKVDGDFRVLTEEDIQEHHQQLCKGNPLLTERHLSLHELQKKYFPDLSRGQIQMNRYMAMTKVSRQMWEVRRLQEHQQRILQVQQELKKQASNDVQKAQQQTKEVLASLPFDQHLKMLNAQRQQLIKRKAEDIAKVQYKTPVKRRAVTLPRRRSAFPKVAPSSLSSLSSAYPPLTRYPAPTVPRYPSYPKRFY